MCRVNSVCKVGHAVSTHAHATVRSLTSAFSLKIAHILSHFEGQSKPNPATLKRSVEAIQKVSSQVNSQTKYD